jgi:hypothetical protein
MNVLIQKQLKIQNRVPHPREVRVGWSSTTSPTNPSRVGPALDTRKAAAGVNTLIHGSYRLVTKSCLPAAAFAVLVFTLMASVTSPAQSTRRPRRESTANRKARIARTIDETYGHRWEAAGGGGFMRYRSGPFLRQNNEVSFWADTLYSLNQKFGILGTIQGSYGKAKIGNTAFDIPNPQISEYAFMAGPSYRFLRKEKYSVSGFVQAGIDLGKFAGGDKGFSAAEIGVWTGDFAPAFSAGANLDYNFDPSFAFRVTPMYLGTRFDSTFQNSKALNVGFVYRFGRKN